MIAVTHFDAGAGSGSAADSRPADSGSADFAADFAERATEVLRLLSARAGYLGGTLARSTDDENHWVLVTTWADVGSYRRAFGADVRMLAVPLYAAALDIPTAFEPFVEAGPDGTLTSHSSDRA